MTQHLSLFFAFACRRKTALFTCMLVIAICFLANALAFAQSTALCPPNIGFEDGTFANWKTYGGSVSVNRNVNPPALAYSLNETAPLYDQHTIIPKSNAIDEFGEFTLNSPNGSNYVLKLGNSTGGHGAEQVSYTLDVPANVNSYSIIFNYAVVLQNPNHQPHEQPKFNVQIIDETTSNTTSCGSFEFVAGGSLPGFQPSKIMSSVLFKPWSPVLLNLTAYLGHRIRLEFTTNDCTFNAHFGYVYLDVTENCSYPVTGNVTCPGTEPIVLKALAGFNEYEWTDTKTGELLGTADSLILPADTPVGKEVSVKLIPFPGLGCIQTLTTMIEGPKVDINQPPPDCNSVDLTAPSVIAGNYPNQTYTYWADADATVALANPKKISKSGFYYIKGQDKRGCFAIGEVKVSIIAAPVINVVDPQPVNYPETVDITNTYVPMPNIVYTYWKDAKATIPLPNPKAVNRDATFYIKASNFASCFTIVPVVANIIYEGIVIPNTFTPNGDGINDLLTVLIDNAIKIKSFKIFNKWGDVVFTTNDIYTYWDGTRRGEPLPVGVYYWMVDGVDGTEMKVKKAGSVTVLK
ncbi:MAG: gliding motility-associated C-terminal domain-containing protein [Bacteroidota bacterium]